MPPPVSRRLATARKKFHVSLPKIDSSLPPITNFTSLNKAIVRGLTTKEQSTLKKAGFSPTVSTKRIGDFPTAGARFTGIRQTVISSRLLKSGVVKPIPGPKEFGGGGSVRNLLEHEIRHQLLQEEGVPAVAQHAEAASRGGKFLRGLVPRVGPPIEKKQKQPFERRESRPLPRPRRPGRR